MARKAKHHYIPKCYLKEFTEGGEDTSPFWCIPKNNTTPFLTSPKDACAERDYYSVDHKNSLLIENWYGTEIEPRISKAIQQIREKSALPNNEGMPNLILLLATLCLRVPSFRATLEAPMKRTKEIVDGISLDVRIRNRDEFDYSQTDLILLEVELIDTVQSCLAGMYFQLYVGDSNCNLVTCDRPFILSPPTGRENCYYGLRTPNIEVFTPITKNAFILARNEPIPEGVFSATDTLIGRANLKLILSANKFFYSSRPSFLLAYEDSSLHEHKIKTSRV